MSSRGAGHRVLVLAPSRSPALVRESRRLIRAGQFFADDGGVRVLAVGELLPLAPARRGTPPAPPLDIARTLEEVLSHAPLDFVHVHEPFAPSTASVALRHSRALNVGTFHAPAERVISTQVARRFVERFFGRLDARTASFEATRALMERAFPAPYDVVLPRRRDAGPRRGRRAAADRVLRSRGAPGAARVPARAARPARGRRLAGDDLHAGRRRAPEHPALAPARPRRGGDGGGGRRGGRARGRGHPGRRLGRPDRGSGPARARAGRGRDPGRQPAARLRGGPARRRARDAVRARRRRDAGRAPRPPAGGRGARAGGSRAPSPPWRPSWPGRPSPRASSRSTPRWPRAGTRRDPTRRCAPGWPRAR